MNLYARGQLEPIVKSITAVGSSSYDKNRATVTLEINDGKGGREEITVEYPIQGGRHLVSLMTDVETGKGFDYIVSGLLTAVIKDSLSESGGKDGSI